MLIRKNPIVRYVLVIMIGLLALTSCRGTETGSNVPEMDIEQNTTMDDMEEPELGERVPPATARIMAEVVEIILPEESQSLTDTYCDSLPCRARIKVVSLIGKGDGFEVQLNTNDTITVYFPTPALSTEELVSDRTSDLKEYTTSGLHPGDLFRADLQMNTNANTLDDSPFVVGRLVRGVE